jgi:hypothetical protein
MGGAIAAGHTTERPTPRSGESLSMQEVIALVEWARTMRGRWGGSSR